jgi:hypothetical protein
MLASRDLNHRQNDQVVDARTPPSFGQHGGAVARPAPKIDDSSSFANISLNLALTIVCRVRFNSGAEDVIPSSRSAIFAFTARMSL